MDPRRGYGAQATAIRRYDVKANQVFNWLRDPLFQSVGTEGYALTFLPVEVIAGDAPLRHEPQGDCGSIEIDLANGHRLRVIGSFDPEAVSLLAQRLGA